MRKAVESCTKGGHVSLVHHEAPGCSPVWEMSLNIGESSEK